MAHDKERVRSIFIFASMGVAMALLIYDAYFNRGWLSATYWGYGFSALYVLFAIITRDVLLGRFIFFGMAAGWVELLPDHWLVAGTHTLIYPPGEPIIDSSPAYMPFSWLTVFIQVGYIGYLLMQRWGLLRATLAVVVLGAIIIPVYEHFAILAGWWSYTDCPKLLNVPWYIIIAEGLLMASVPYFFNKVQHAKLWAIPLLGVAQGMVMWLCCIIGFLIAGR